MTTTVGRNDPCPCGSGKKYKNCCEGTLQLGTRIKTSGPWLWIALGAVVLVVAAFVLLRPQSPAVQATAPPAAMAPTPSASLPSTTMPPTTTTTTTVAPLTGSGPLPPAASSPTASATPASGTPQPWQYDAGTNRHWDPTHGHWHDGPPPPASARGATPPVGAPGTTPAAGTPAPWTYDAAKNQHWDPTHGHWHPGPPPTNR